MGARQAVKLAFIGGLSGGIWYFMAFSYPSLFSGILFRGLLFSIVGVGVSITLILAIPELSSEKGKMLLGGVAAGFCAGLFPLRLFYSGVIILPILIGITIKLLRVPKIALRISCGGILGGVAGAFFSLLPWLSLKSSFVYLSLKMQYHATTLTGTVSSSMLFYLLTLGMLITVRKR